MDFKLKIHNLKATGALPAIYDSDEELHGVAVTSDLKSKKKKLRRENNKENEEQEDPRCNENGYYRSTDDVDDVGGVEDVNDDDVEHDLAMVLELKKSINIMKHRLFAAEACSIHQDKVLRNISNSNSQESVINRQLIAAYNRIIQSADFNLRDKQNIWNNLFNVNIEKEVSLDTKNIIKQFDTGC